MMNDYMDYYSYINNLNQMQNGNQMIEPNQMTNSNTNKMNKSNGLAEPYQGFARGNMFNNLYEEYKNYTPQELNPTNDKEYLMMLLQMYCFAAHDLGLYLDVNPNDRNVIRQRAEYIRMYNETLAQYENSFGPLMLDGTNLAGSEWNWSNSPWPWEGSK